MEAGKLKYGRAPRDFARIKAHWAGPYGDDGAVIIDKAARKQ